MTAHKMREQIKRNKENRENKKREVQILSQNMCAQQEVAVSPRWLPYSANFPESVDGSLMPARELAWEFPGQPLGGGWGLKRGV